MPTPPDATAVSDYLTELGLSDRWTPTQVAEALAAETAAQARRCRILPLDVEGEPVEPYIADLAEALKRRVAHNLALRALPLGVKAGVGDAGVAVFKVGGLDAEVRRLEAPYRKLVMG